MARLVLAVSALAAVAIAGAIAGAGVAQAQEVRSFRLALDPEIEASGLRAHLLPRFTLKTGRRAELVGDGADVAIGPEGERALMARGGRVFFLTVRTDNPAARLFADWIAGDIGQRTIAAFQPRAGAAFTPAPQDAVVAEVSFDGDAALGLRVARAQCARCHRVTAARGAMDLGSTPSFPALRALPDWAERFQSFHALAPHPAFLRVSGLSPPFDPARPPPIVPVEITLEEVEALGAYAAGLSPADLGAPISDGDLPHQ